LKPRGWMEPFRIQSGTDGRHGPLGSVFALLTMTKGSDSLNDMTACSGIHY
jgi:hypothetical protein